MTDVMIRVIDKRVNRANDVKVKDIPQGSFLGTWTKNAEQNIFIRDGNDLIRLTDGAGAWKVYDEAEETIYNYEPVKIQIEIVS